MRRFLGILFCATLALSTRAGYATLITFDDLPATASSETYVGTNVALGGTASGYRAIRPGYYQGDTKLVLSVTGITVTISRQNGKPFDIVDNTLNSQVGKGDSFGTRSLDPFYDTSVNGFIFSFSDPIRAFSLLSGDFGGDPDGLILKAYYGENLAGGLVPGSTYSSTIPGTVERTWTEDRFYTAVTDPEAAGFKSVLFYGGVGDFSVFLDRIWFERDPVEVANLIEDPGLYYYDQGLDDVENTGDITSIVPEPTGIALMIGGAMLLAARRRGKHG
ncbi:MAG: PEP-CTERM sorting domain-containing protein [Phycisphaerales bacterium]